MTIKPEITLQ